MHGRALWRCQPEGCLEAKMSAASKRAECAGTALRFCTLHSLVGKGQAYNKIDGNKTIQWKGCQVSGWDSSNSSPRYEHWKTDVAITNNFTNVAVSCTQPENLVRMGTPRRSNTQSENLSSRRCTCAVTRLTFSMHIYTKPLHQQAIPFRKHI